MSQLWQRTDGRNLNIELEFFEFANTKSNLIHSKNLFIQKHNQIIHSKNLPIPEPDPYPNPNPKFFPIPKPAPSRNSLKTRWTLFVTLDIWNQHFNVNQQRYVICVKSCKQYWTVNYKDKFKLDQGTLRTPSSVPSASISQTPMALNAMALCLLLSPLSPLLSPSNPQFYPIVLQCLTHIICCW